MLIHADERFSINDHTWSDDISLANWSAHKYWDVYIIKQEKKTTHTQKCHAVNSSV